MALAVNDVLQITDVQTFLGQQMLNVYHFRVVSFEPSVDYAHISDQFELMFIGAIDDIQSSQVTHTRIIIQNLTNGVDINEEPISHAGTASGDALPSVVAASFRLVRTNATTRHGSKRIGGLPEGHIAGNSVAAGVVSEYNEVAAVMGSNFETTGLVDFDFVLEPVIVARYPTGHAQAGEMNLAVLNPVASAQFIRISSQTTRREGRGS